MKTIPLTRGKVALVDDDDFGRLSFPSLVAAGRAYDAAAKQYFGEFARLNFPDDGEKNVRSSWVS